MRFWDSSALVPLLVTEATSAAVTDALVRDPEIMAWWGTPVECVSALSRLEREGDLTTPSIAVAVARLDALASSWREVQPGARVREIALRLLRVHQIPAADALQLGAAIVAAEQQPSTLPLVTLDERLAIAAEREGFPVVRPA